MGSKFRFILMLILIFCGFILLQIIFFLYNTEIIRSPSSLLNQYYKLKNVDPLAARRSLEILLAQDPHNQVALRELAYWYLNQGDIRSSISQFEKAYQNDPRDVTSALQLSKLYIALNQPDKASAILLKLSPVNMPDSLAVKDLLAQIGMPKKEMIQTTTNQLIKNQIHLSFIQFESTCHIPTPEETLLLGLQQSFHINLNRFTHQGETVTIAKKINQQQSPAPIASTISERDKLMNEYYELNKNKSPLAWEKINEVLAKYPNDVQALKEAGYYALLKLKSDKISAKYFLRVYELTSDPKIALQLGYIFDNLKKKRFAYHFFDLATNTTNLKDQMTAELAKTNLRGVQTKFIPAPFYATLDYSPLYMSRFKLFINPIIFNAGILLNDKYNWRVYYSYRRTSDDKSNTSNLISNIFEDDAAISALGTRFTPLPSMPQLILFTEIGKSVDLVYRDRARWRSDFRGGAAYYNEWGRPAGYTLKPQFMFQPNADLYCDAIYYNRYHDGIATLRFRPGVKVFRYGSTTIDLYYRTFIIEDQQRQFYNNILELGPGIAIRPSDRYNVVFRYEQNHGRYLPAHSPSPNPYSSHYYNGVSELDTYFEF